LERVVADKRLRSLERTVRWLFFLALLAVNWPSVALGQTAIFRSTTHLQSIAVQVVDSKGNFVPGLTANDFTVLEDGRAQKIAFFGAQRQPASLAILLDSSRSMDFDRKFDQARELIAPLIAGQHPNDQIFLMPFSDRVETLKLLLPEERRRPELIQIERSGIDRGTALYDALASALCRMRNAENLKQAVVLLTDGADQHSRLRLDQLIELARMSTPQIFMIGFFGRAESEVFHQSAKTVTLFGDREIDNPVFAFDRLAKESGAESFFPVSEVDLKAAIDRISQMLEAQYTLAYYPEKVDRFRRIEVRVRPRGVKTITRHGVGGAAAQEPVIFKASTCEVSATDHPYPWEPKSNVMLSGGLAYHEDFADPKSGWPNRTEPYPTDRPRSAGNAPAGGGGFKRALRYVSGAYEVSQHPPPGLSTASILDGIVAAHGPAWHNFRASVSVRSDWMQTFRTERTSSPKWDLLSYFHIAPALVFHVSYDGYDALLLAGGQMKRETNGEQHLVEYFRARRKYETKQLAEFDTRRLKWFEEQRRRFAGEHFEALYRQWLEQDMPDANPGVGRILQFKLVRKLFGRDEQGEHRELIPWTVITPPAIQDKNAMKVLVETHQIGVEYTDGRITVIVDDRQVGTVRDDRFPSGMIGLAVFGRGDAVFDDLSVETLR
jgi:Ca-activated chloride channel family protein